MPHNNPQKPAGWLTRLASEERLDPDEQLYPWLIFGGIVIAGFFFGVVAGYQPSRPTPAVGHFSPAGPSVLSKENTASSPKDPTGKGSASQPVTPGDDSSRQHTDNVTTGSPTAVAPVTPPQESAPPGGTPPMKPETPPATSVANQSPVTMPPSSLPSQAVGTPPAGTPSTTPSPMPSPTPMASSNKTPSTANTTPVSFQKDVLPIFRSYCLNCHGAGTGRPKGNVDLRTVAAIKKGGGGPILEIGNPEKSAIYFTILDGSMPPDGKRPTRDELEIIRRWILEGAKD